MRQSFKKISILLCAFALACAVCGCGGGDKNTPPPVLVTKSDVWGGVLTALARADGVTVRGEGSEAFTLQICGEDLAYAREDGMYLANIADVWVRRRESGAYDTTYAPNAGGSYLAFLAEIPESVYKSNEHIESVEGVYTLTQPLLETETVKRAINFVRENADETCGEALAHALHPEYTAEALAADLRAMLADANTIGAFARAFDDTMKHIHRDATLEYIFDTACAMAGITAEDVAEALRKYLPVAPAPKAGEKPYHYFMYNGGALVPLDVLFAAAGTSLAEVRAYALAFVEDETMLFGEEYDARVAPALSQAFVRMLRSHGVSEAAIEALGDNALCIDGLSRLGVEAWTVRLTLRVDERDAHIRDYTLTQEISLWYEKEGEFLQSALLATEDTTEGTVTYDTGAVAFPEGDVAPCFLADDGAFAEKYLCDGTLALPLYAGQGCTELAAFVRFADDETAAAKCEGGMISLDAQASEKLCAIGGSIVLSYRLGGEAHTREISLLPSPDEEMK